MIKLFDAQRFWISSTVTIPLNRRNTRYSPGRKGGDHKKRLGHVLV